MIERGDTTGRAKLIASAVLIATLVLPQRAMAVAPPDEPKPATSEPAAAASEAGVRSALADGDLTLAREQAVALRSAEPTVEHFELEADVHEAIGDYASAQRALRGALERVPKEDASKREAIEDRLEQLRERGRGTLDDEPVSSHRERLDAERAERLAALRPTVVVPVEPVDVPPPRVPIVKKWYFWVTLTTIVGAAVAITAVAIDANVGDDAASRLPSNGPQPGGGGFTLRF